MSRSETLSSIDSITAQETFESIYSLVNSLKEKTTNVRDGLKACNRRIIDLELSERLLTPKPHSAAWFKKRKMETPCDMEDFLQKLFSEIAAQRRICHRTRTIILNEEAAGLFHLTPNYIYRWTEVLERLPEVFY